MRRLLLFLALAGAVQANTLRLEFAQEGEPSQPRAIIVIHNAFEDRQAFKPFFEAWATHSWARDQFCSVYSYEYEGSGLRDLVAYDLLAKDLYARIRSNDFDRGKADDINVARRTSPTDGRQPAANLKGEKLELLLAGSGYGGLVARQVSVLAKKDELKVTRVAYLGTPLDGLSTIDLVNAFGSAEGAARLGLSQPLDDKEMAAMSLAWWSLVELFDEHRDWNAIYAPVYALSKNIAAYGSQAGASDPFPNVLYGRQRSLVKDEKSHDGFLPQLVAWGKNNGPVGWESETGLAKTPHADLTESQSDIVLKKLVDQPILYGYLARRQGIEEFIRGDDLELPPLYVYWDEREGAGQQPVWRGAYATRKALYEMMWGVAP